MITSDFFENHFFFHHQKQSAGGIALLKFFTKFTEKHLCGNLNKVPGLGPATLLKRRLRHRCFHFVFFFLYKTLPVASVITRQKIQNTYFFLFRCYNFKVPGCNQRCTKLVYCCSLCPASSV